MVFVNHIKNAPHSTLPQDTDAKGTVINIIDLRNAINLVTFRTFLPIHQQQIDERYIYRVLFFNGNQQHFPTVTHSLTLTGRTNPFHVSTTDMCIVHSECHLVHLQHACMRRRNNNEKHFALALTIKSTFLLACSIELFDFFFVWNTFNLQCVWTRWNCNK